MKRTFLLISAAFATLLGGSHLQAQTDVTSQYITNPGFEDCEVVADNDKGAADVHADFSVASGTDYSAHGWKLVEQKKSANGGAISYKSGLMVQYSKWNGLGDPGPEAGPTGTTGNKGLCFAGNASVVYQQAEAITLPAGSYTLTVNVWARNGETSNPKPTQQVVNILTGFMPEGGSEAQLIPAKRNSVQFTSNGWDTEVLTIELTEATTGRIQLSYGSSFFVVIDDIKLEYAGGVVTTGLAKVITKAKALNAELSNSDLSTAISNAEAFIENPTTQEDVNIQIETLYSAMGSALSATTKVVNITAAYLENPSFETGKIEPWAWGSATGNVGAPTNSESLPFIDGSNIAEFATSGTNAITQTITHMPIGYYAIDAKLNQKTNLKVGTSSTLCQGGSNALYLRVHPVIFNNTTASSEIAIGSQYSAAYRVDNFRLFYGKDEASLLEELLKAVKADAQTILDMADYAVVTGQERTNLNNALNGTDINTINTAANAFVAAKDSYKALEKAKTDAAAYTTEAYPYASASIYQQIQTLIATDATSATVAATMKTQLETLCFQFYVSNAYCEGVENAKEYTDLIAAANATGTSVHTAWHKLNMGIRTDQTAWKNPKTGVDDKNVYGTNADASSSSKDKSYYMYQNVSGVPKGKYVLSMVVMSNSSVQPSVQINKVEIGKIQGIGTYGTSGKYGGAWVENTFEFQKDDANDMELRIAYTGTANYQNFYFDNLRLYCIEGEGTATGINTVERVNINDNRYYNLAGQRVEQPTKGLYIVNGRKVVIK